jgi:hypothetical protein
MTKDSKTTEKDLCQSSLRDEKLNITKEGRYNLAREKYFLIPYVQHMRTDRQLTEENLDDSGLRGEKLNIVTDDYDKATKENNSLILEFQNKW